MLYTNEPLSKFISDLSSGSPAPGGAAAAAISGTTGISLTSMVANLNLAKEEETQKKARMSGVYEECTKLTNRLLELVDEDEKGFLPLLEAYKLPKGTDEEKAERLERIEACKEAACKAPLEIMTELAKGLELTQIVLLEGGGSALSDILCAAYILDGALRSAAANVFINTASMKNVEAKGDLNAKANELLYIFTEKAKNIIDYAKNKLGMPI